MPPADPFDALLAHRAWVRAVARALVADENDADDVEQQTWLLALERPPRRATSLRGWLGAATRNVARKLGRGRSRRVRHEDAARCVSRPNADAPAADLVAEAEVQQRIGRFVLELDEPFRATVLLRYFDGLAPADVAARLGVPVATVRSRLRRAHERLRARLDDAAGGRRAAWSVPALLTSETAAPSSKTPAKPYARPQAVPHAVPQPFGDLARSVPLGGLVMTGAQKLLAAAMLLAVAGTAAWIATHASSSGEIDAATRTSDEDETSDGPRRPTRARRGEEPTGPSATPAAADLPPPVDLDRADRDLDVHGTVVDAAGRGVAGARIAAVTYPWRAAELLNTRDYDVEVAGPTTRTAIDGTFTIRLARGENLALRVAAEGFVPIEYAHVVAGERLRVTLQTGVRLVVTLKDAGGAPVAGAAFRLRSGSDDDAAPRFRAQGTTGPDGVVALGGLPPGERAFAEAEHREKGTGFWTALDLPVSGELRRELTIAAARVLSGRVVDAETKAPVGGAQVGIHWTFDLPVTTREDGTFDLPGWSGAHGADLHVRADGYATTMKDTGTAAHVEVELARGWTATGRVIGADGQPVAQAQVSLIGVADDDTGGGISHEYAVTDARGQFRVTGLRVGVRHVIVVLARGHARVRREAPESVVTTAGEVDLGDVAMPEPRRVEGVVVAGADRPQRRTVVILSGPLTGDELGSFYGRSVVVATDDLGRFRFDDVGPGSYDIKVRPAHGQEIVKRIDVRPDADLLGVRIERPATRDVTVTVTDPEGAPLPGVWIGFTDSQNRQIQGRADATGVARVELPANAEMTWSVYPPFEGGRTFVQPPWKRVPDDATDLRVALEAAAFVTGRLLTPEGTGVASASVRLVDADGRESWFDTDGSGAFRAIVPARNRLALVFEGTVHPKGTAADSGLSARVDDIAPGADVTVRCTRVALDRSLTVVVVSPRGEPVEQAWVSLHSRSGSYPRGPYAQADAAGRVVLRDLPAREMSLIVTVHSSEFVEPVRAQVTPDGQEMRVVCRTASRTAGVLVDAAGTAVRGGMVRAERRGEFVAYAQVAGDGRFVLLLPESDTAPIRLVVDRDNDGTPEASRDDVVPGTQDVRLVVGK